MLLHAPQDSTYTYIVKGLNDFFDNYFPAVDGDSLSSVSDPEEPVSGLG